MTYKPVKNGIPKNYATPDPVTTDKSSSTSSTSSILGQSRVKILSNIKMVSYLDSIEKIKPRITAYAARGHALSSMSFLLGATEIVWDKYYLKHENVINTAMSEGKIIGEIEAIEWLRFGAANCGSFSALKYMGEMQYGWGSGGAGSELPTGIAFEMIGLEGENNNDEE